MEKLTTPRTSPGGLTDHVALDVMLTSQQASAAQHVHTSRADIQVEHAWLKLKQHSLLGSPR